MCNNIGAIYRKSHHLFVRRLGILVNDGKPIAVTMRRKLKEMRFAGGVYLRGEGRIALKNGLKGKYFDLNVSGGLCLSYCAHPGLPLLSVK